MIFQPFKVGDLIETGGTVGVVREIQLFSAIVVTGDNKVVTMPNGAIQDSNIVNYSRLGILRADLNVDISYTDDLVKAKQVLEEIVTADERVLRDPPPQVIVVGLGASGVSLGVRPFVKLADYWNMGPDLRERIKLRFDEEGITIPFPQQDVYLFQPARGDKLPVETGASNLTNPSF